MADGWARCALGRVQVDSPQSRDQAQILLRPEQLQLSARPSAVAGDSEAEGCPGTITHTDFRGPECEVTVEIRHLDTITEIRLHSPSWLALDVGARVLLTVRGRAHVFG